MANKLARLPAARAAAKNASSTRGIAAGGAKNKGGKKVEEPLVAGLVREDKKVVYPIRDGIPVLLIDEGIEVAG